MEQTKIDEFKNKITKEFEEFKINIFDKRVEDIFKSAYKIHVYKELYIYLLKSNCNDYINLTLNYIYNYYINEIDLDINFLLDKDIKKLIDKAHEEYNRNIYNKKYEDEYEEFLSSTLKLEKRDIYNLYEKIRFYENLYYWLQNTEYEDNKNLTKGISLNELYNIFKDKCFDQKISTAKDICDFLKEVNK